MTPIELIEIKFPDHKIDKIDNTSQKCIITLSPINSFPACAYCGSKKINKFGKRILAATDTPLEEKPVKLKFIAQRFYCKNCKRTFLQKPIYIQSNHRLTTNAFQYIIENKEKSRTKLAKNLGITSAIISKILQNNNTRGKQHE